ncbi:MAG TPA: FAD-dependent oxidoreductase [Myxococcales bacterium]|nr:FAD-dependent oxidoreductase [Myxococcales bacterium]
MPDFTYLIIGGGMAAAAAAKGIREVDAQGSIGILAAESHKPYARPPLSKALWQGKPEESVWLELPGGVEVVQGRRAVAIDKGGHRVRDDRGQEHGYRKLLLATGGAPRKLPFAADVIYFRTLDDYRRLRSLPGERVVVIGGGFIGSEVAAGLQQNGKKVTMIFPEDGICARAFPQELTKFVTAYYREKGVEVLAGESVAGIERGAVKTRSGRSVAADAVVAGIGIAPSVELATLAGLPVNDGVEVDESLRTSDPDIYAAGDVARFHNPLLGKRIRVEHEDAANTMGAAAGRAMAGAKVSYSHLPFFYSDLFELGYEAVGELDARHQALADWKTQFREGIVYYLQDTIVRGVLLWGIFGRVDEARALIGKPLPANRL